MVSQEIVKKIADKRAAAYGIDLSKMNVQIIDKSERWDKAILSFQLYNPANKSIKDASKREYYIVAYQPKQLEPGYGILGGEYYVFIDKYSGEVLLEYAGK